MTETKLLFTMLSNVDESPTLRISSTGAMSLYSGSSELIQGTVKQELNINSECE